MRDEITWLTYTEVQVTTWAALFWGPDPWKTRQRLHMLLRIGFDQISLIHNVNIH